MKKFRNVAYTYNVKGKNPFTDEWDYSYLVPSLKDQQGPLKNYVVVCCEPSKNGVYVYPYEKLKEYKTWVNGKKTCLYVPIEDCEFTSFEDMEPERLELLKPSIKKLQKKWLNKEVKNHNYEYKRGKPEWMF